eukprot:2895398-Rhodomonas_salina.2
MEECGREGRRAGDGGRGEDWGRRQVEAGVCGQEYVGGVAAGMLFWRQSQRACASQAGREEVQSVRVQRVASRRGGLMSGCAAGSAMASLRFRRRASQASPTPWSAARSASRSSPSARYAGPA